MITNPAGGTYECALPELFPAAGNLFVECGLVEAEQLAPAAHGDW